MSSQSEHNIRTQQSSASNECNFRKNKNCHVNNIKGSEKLSMENDKEFRNITRAYQSVTTTKSLNRFMNSLENI
jgi:hypothetical protein